MAFIMLATLYISRIILQILGVVDYGIYTLIAGFVSMFAFLTSTISSGASRFFAYEIGVGNKDRLHKYFNVSILSFSFLAVIILLLAETIGLWFVNNKLVIPAERLHAALILYHFAVFSFVVNMFSLPYKSMVIAHEKMDFYAYIGIAEVILNLILVYALNVFSVDKLGFYGFLLFLLNAIITFSFYLYCRIKYEESRYYFFWDKKMFNKFFSYSFWVIVGSISSIFRGQGLNIVLNIFFGPTINAARGIAFQVHSAINQFVNNFYTACRPQITKLYAAGKSKEFMQLIYSSSRICYMLTLLFTAPVFLETPSILEFWLETVPDYTVLFTRLVLVTILIETISYPFQAAISATGNVKWYQIITGTLTILTLPIGYLFLKLGYPPESVFYVTIAMAICAQISRLIFMRYLLRMSILSFFKNVVTRMILLTLFTIILPLCIHCTMAPSISRLLLVAMCSFMLVALGGYYIGISKNERDSIKSKLNNYVGKFFGKK